MNYSPSEAANELISGLSAKYCQQLNSAVPATLQLQRVVVRMLFDKDFTEQVYAAPDTALAGLEITDSLKQQLIDNDPRAWRVDTLRQRRTLSTLIEEFKISSALYLNKIAELERLEHFFSSALFHQCVQYRGHLALAFCEYMHADFVASEPGAHEYQAFCAALTLETQMAIARRDFRNIAIQRRRKPLKSGVAASPGVNAALISDAAFEVFRIVNEYLFEVSLIPALTLCRDAPRIGQLPESFSTAQWYLFEPKNSRDVQVDVVEERYGRLIQLCAAKVQDIRSLRKQLRDIGQSKAQIRSMVTALASANVLTTIGSDE